MSCKPAPSLSFPLPLGGWLLREVSRLISWGSTCRIGLPWSRMWWLACRYCHPKVVTLLRLLEVVTGVGFCHLCCNLEPHYRCVGAPLLTPPTSWSQILEQTPRYGMTASTSGVTTPSTSSRGMSGLVPPPQGVSIWDPFLWKAPIPLLLGISPLYRPLLRGLNS